MTAKHIIIAGFLTVIGTGCYEPINPCTNDALKGFLLEAELQACEECNATECPGDTGGEEFETVLCPQAPGGNSGLWCMVDPPQSGKVSLTNDGWAEYPKASCGQLSEPFDETPSLFGQRILCQTFGAEVDLPQGTNEGWHVCRSDNKFYAARHLGANPDADWIAGMGCLPFYFDAGGCPLGIAGTPASGATCVCDSDEDCQSGAICKGEVTFNDGAWSPTTCIWDGAPGNGQQPDGPPAYGLDYWAEGVEVDGDFVTISAGFYASLMPGLLNDDQRADVDTGEILYCGRESLCAHLGLASGDVLSIDPDVDAFELGQRQVITVTAPNGGTRDLVVSLGMFD